MLINDKSIWPPAYSLRLSKKARHLHLKIIPNQGLEIVVPYRHRHAIDVNELLIEKRHWIEKHLATLNIQPPTRIEILNLYAIGQEWHVKYQATDHNKIRAITRPHNNELVLYGNINNILLTHAWLKQWLKQMAKIHLLPWLADLSKTHALPYSKANIRAQQTLWGSCNWQKNISLNYKLLFLPKNYVTHIILHELCHTKFLNHSTRFWDLLTKLDPNCIQHNMAMRSAEQYIPLQLG